MNWNIDDVPIYAAVVDHRGITAAANYLNISKSTVSKSVSRLEQALGVRLLDRNSRNIRITSEGQAFYRHSLMILEQVSEANEVMAGLTSQPGGRLVVALPMAFSREIVARHLAEFRQQYPLIELEIIITSHPVDIIRDQIDIAVMIGVLNDSELMVKKLHGGKLLCVSSPDYVEKNIKDQTEEDFASHIQICEKRYATRQFSIRDHEQKKVIDLTKNIISVNDPIAVREAVIHGCGISIIPDQYCKEQLQNGDLIQVFDHISFDAAASVLAAVYPSRRLISNKTRAFLDFLTRICEQI